jgi:hypothetical protein
LRKIILFSLVVFLASCAGIRKAGRSGEVRKDEIALSDVISQNLSKGNFYIQKANVEIEDGNTSLSFVATIKYIVPDKYLISARLRTGIELARIYINSDTIMANDRINKIFYTGKPGILSARYGIPLEILPVLFGDLITDAATVPEMKCNDGKIMLDSYVKGLKIAYEIDCSRRKTLSMRQQGSFSGVTAEILYNKFESYDNQTHPMEISVFHKESGYNVKLNIEKIESPWNGTIDFIPGSRYKRMELR